MIPLTQTAIAGIGETDYSRMSGRSELRLAAEASIAAIRDAGLTPNDIDGVITFTMDFNDELELQRTLGIQNLRWTSRTPFGGAGANATIQLAAAAVASGAANAVLIYRAFNERSGRRFGSPESHKGFGMAGKQLDPHYTLKLDTAAKGYALEAQLYMRRYGVTSEDFGRYVVSTRDYAATNPRAMFYQQPLTLEQHQASRWIVEPVIRRWDCCLETDGGAAIVVTSLERAKDLRQAPVQIRAATQMHAIGQRIVYDIYCTEEEREGKYQALNDELERQSGVRPSDVDVVMIYDAFSPGVLAKLENHGICGRGEAKDFIASGATGRGGSKPVNPNGGLIGEAYLHGINNIIEGARQIRGQAANQVAHVETVLVTGNSAIILGKV